MSLVSWSGSSPICFDGNGMWATQSASRARISSRSLLASTPTGSLPAISPASRPALAGDVTYTPASSRSGWSRMALIEWRPTLPVAHWTTR